MAFEMKDMSGALFKNAKKSQQKEGAPDYRGDCMIAGYKFRISGWIKTPKSGGEKFISFKFEADKDQAPPPSPMTNQVAAAAAKHAPDRPASLPPQTEQQDDIPF